MMHRLAISCLLLAALAGCATTGKILEGPPTGIEPDSEAPKSTPSARPDASCPPGDGPWIRDLTRDWTDRRYLLPDGTSCTP